MFPKKLLPRERGFDQTRQRMADISSLDPVPGEELLFERKDAEQMAQDAASLLLPTDRTEIERAIRGLKVAKLLAGYRGRPAGDIEGAIDAVMAIAAFAEAHRHRLAELDVNPLLVLPEGQGALAVDALIVMSPE